VIFYAELPLQVFLNLANTSVSFATSVSNFYRKEAKSAKWLKNISSLQLNMVQPT